MLETINEIMTNLKLNYEFMEWTSDIVYPYWVGSYLETPTLTEDGAEEYDFYLTGFTRNNWLELETEKELIRKTFNNTRKILEDGSGIVINYSSGDPIETGEAELKRIDVKLKVQEWRVTNE